jgi:hypothetical protein
MIRAILAFGCDVRVSGASLQTFGRNLLFPNSRLKRFNEMKGNRCHGNNNLHHTAGISRMNNTL